MFNEYTPIFNTVVGVDIYNLIRDRNKNVYNLATAMSKDEIKVDNKEQITEIEAIAAFCLSIAMSVEDITGGDTIKLCKDIANVIFIVAKSITEAQEDTNE